MQMITTIKNGVVQSHRVIGDDGSVVRECGTYEEMVLYGHFPWFLTEANTVQELTGIPMGRSSSITFGDPRIEAAERACVRHEKWTPYDGRGSYSPTSICEEWEMKDGSVLTRNLKCLINKPAKGGRVALNPERVIVDEMDNLPAIA